MATALVMALVNAIFLFLTLTLHVQGYPNVLDCYLRPRGCRISSVATFYHSVILILMTKAVILPIAMFIEFAVAVDIAKGNRSQPCKCKGSCVFLLKSLVIWQIIIFLHITIGLISIPAIVLFFISPAQVLLYTGIFLLIIILLIFILLTIPLPCKFHGVKVYILIIEILLISAVLLFAFCTYCLIIRDGMKMDGVTGYIVSLLPTIVISVIAWIIKSKFLKNKRKGMEEEMINLEPVSA